MACCILAGLLVQGVLKRSAAELSAMGRDAVAEPRRSRFRLRRR
jgi:hypothetical protein